MEWHKREDLKPSIGIGCKPIPMIIKFGYIQILDYDILNTYNDDIKDMLLILYEQYKNGEYIPTIYNTLKTYEILKDGEYMLRH